jgi:hypothetical protein
MTMAIPTKNAKWLTTAEADFYAQLQNLGKKDTLQQLAEDFYRSNLPGEKNFTADCSWLARHIIIAGINAASEQGWPVEKTIKQISQGVLEALTKAKLQFIAAACILMRAAVQAALMSKTDVGKTTETIVGVTIKAGSKSGENLPELSKKISRTAVITANSFPKEDKSSMKKILMDLLDGKLKLED